MRGEVKMSARAVIFDLDGVLVDSADAHLAAYKQIFSDVGLEFPEAAANAVRAGKPRKHVIEMATPGANEQERERLVVAKPHALEALLQGRGPFGIRGAAETVRALSRANVPLGVVTNSRTPELWLRSLGLERELSVVVSGDDVASPKPSPEGYLLAASRMGIDPAHCIAVEDSEDGWTAATRAGMRVVVLGSSRPAWLSDSGEVVPTLEPAAALAWVGKP